MGFEWNIRRSTLAISLVFGSSGVGAASPEPLVVTALADPHLVLLPGQTAQSDEQSLDQATARFRLAISEALQSDQRAVEEACRSRPSADASSSARFAWQARCVYRRR